MPLRLSDLKRVYAFPASNEDLRASLELQQRPWKDGYPHATSDASFARERVDFKRTESISSLDLEAGKTRPIPIPGPKRERDFTMDDVTAKWKHVEAVHPWESDHWVRKNVDDHVQTEWNDPTGKNDSAALGVILSKCLTEVDTNSSAKLLGLEHKTIHERVSVISKVAQATHAAEHVLPTFPRFGRVYPKVQKKRGPAPRVPFAQLAKSESSSDDDGADDEGESSEQESSCADESSSEQGFSDGMDL